MTTATKETDVDVLRKDIDELKSALSTLAGDVKAAVKSRESDLASSARARVEEIGENATRFARKAAERGREGAEAVGDTIRDRPLQSMVVAFGVGLLLSRLLGRR